MFLAVLVILFIIAMSVCPTLLSIFSLMVDNYSFEPISIEGPSINDVGNFSDFLTTPPPVFSTNDNDWDAHERARSVTLL